MNRIVTLRGKKKKDGKQKINGMGKTMVRRKQERKWENVKIIVRS
jgi:hypothetical protein